MHSADQSTNVTLFGFCQATDCHRPLLSTRPWRTNVAPSNVEATWRSYMRFRSLNSLQAVRSSHIPHHPTSANPKAEQEQNLCDKIRPVCQVLNSMHEYAICFQIWQTNRQKPNEHSGAFMTVQPQWDHLSIHQLLTNSGCSVALYFRLRFRQSSTWPCRGISRQLGWKVRKVVKFYIWHGNSLLIHTEERQNYFPRKTCFIVQMLLFYISKFEAWRLKYEPNTKMTERQNLQPSLVAHKQVLAKHRGAAMCCEKMW